MALTIANSLNSPPVITSTGSTINGTNGSSIGFTPTPSTTVPTAPTTSLNSSAPAGTKTSSETERYTRVQQDLSTAKSAVSAASAANSQIDTSLRQVREVATKLADDNITGKTREKLQADYQQLREGILKNQEQAGVKNGDKKTNLLTDSKALTTSTNTRGGELQIDSAKAAKALGLPEKITSSAQARALLATDDNQAGTLANAEKTTRQTSARLKKSATDVDERLQTSTAVAKAVQRLDDAQNGNASLSTDKTKLRDQALEKALAAGEKIKTQLGGLGGGNSKNTNPLLALLG